MIDKLCEYQDNINEEYNKFMENNVYNEDNESK